MRLIRSVARLESAVRRALGAQRAVGLVWTEQEERIIEAHLAAGDLIACDLYLTGWIGEVPQLRVRERVTHDQRDLGLVYGLGGERVGRVMAIDGSLLTWELDDGAEWAPPAGPAVG